MSLRTSILLFVFYGVCAGLTAEFSGPAVIAASMGTGEPAWRRVISEKEEFSVMMPGEPTGFSTFITDSSGSQIPERIYTSYAKGSVYLVVAYDRFDVGGTLENFKAHHLYQGEASHARDLTLAGDKGKEYRLKFRAGAVTGTLQVFATRKHGYAVAIIQAREDPLLTKYFLSTFSLTTSAFIWRDPLPDFTAPESPKKESKDDKKVGEK